MFVWFAFISEHILYFQEKSSLFLFSPEYLSEKLWKPGGILYCLSAFLTSFYYYPVAGAMIISGIITLATLVISHCVSIISGRNEKIYPFVIGLLMFLLHTDYAVFIQNSLGFLLQVSAFSIFVQTAKKSMGWILYILSPLLYLVTGGFSWIFMILATAYLVIFERRSLLFRIVLLWITMYLFYLISLNFFFFSSSKALLFYPAELPEDSLSRMIFLILSGLLMMLPLIAIVRFPVANILSVTYISENVIRAMAILVIMLTIGVYRYDKKNMHYFKAEKLFQEGRYEKLIEYNTKNPSKNTLTLFLNNIALAEKGILNDRLFDFPQSPDGKTLFLKWEMVTEILKRGGYFYYTLGMINEAHRWAYENMVMTGNSPEGLKMLIKTELINGNYQMASKYISLLKNSLFYKKEAQHFEKFLFDDAALEADRELGDKRKIRLRTDFFSITDDPYINVERISITDSLNRKAFEYKIAFLLLRKDYKNLSDNLSRFEELGYSAFPVNVEEALLAISTMSNGVNPYHGNLRVRSSTEERWTQFLTLFQKYGNNPRMAEPALRNQFGNTFWYWAFYR